MDVKKEIWRLAIHNAAKFNGKASEKSVIGLVLGNIPELRKNIDTAKQLIAEIIPQVNSLSKEELAKELQKFPLEEKAKQKVKALKPLKNVKPGAVIMRFAPSPSGPLHIGHAYGLLLNYAYVKKNRGKFYLRIEDTNPENIYAPAYELLVEDANWLTGNGVTAVIIQSERLGLYYDYAEKLVEMGGAYVCECNSDDFRTLVFKKKCCPCRALKKEEHTKRFAKMFSSYSPGEAVLRCKTDITHKNPAMRDFPLMRINEHPHPRKGTEYRVWPLMNLAVFVDDAELGITHIIRAKEHRDNAKRQEYLYNYFNKPIPETMFLGRINFEDMRVSCSKTKILIEEGKFSGWDDIRIPFLKPLRRRGYQPAAFLRYAIEIGLSETDKTVKKEQYFKTLDAFNRNAIDPEANRYFFIKDPVKIRIINVERREMKLSLHPDFEMRGFRKMKISENFYVDKQDYDSLPPGVSRLMDCLNFTRTGELFEFHSFDYEQYKESGKKIIHWLPVSDKLVEVIIRMPDGTVVGGLGEPSLTKLKVGEIIQFERFGFARLDKKEDKFDFWFAHR